MALSLKSALGGAGRPIGSEAWFPDRGEIIAIDGREYLRSGLALVDEAEQYPELFDVFGVSDGPNIKVEAPSYQSLSNNEVAKYMRIK